MVQQRSIRQRYARQRLRPRHLRPDMLNEFANPLDLKPPRVVAAANALMRPVTHHNIDRPLVREIVGGGCERRPEPAEGLAGQLVPAVADPVVGCGAIRRRVALAQCVPGVRQSVAGAKQQAQGRLVACLRPILAAEFGRSVRLVVFPGRRLELGVRGFAEIGTEKPRTAQQTRLAAAELRMKEAPHGI